MKTIWLRFVVVTAVFFLLTAGWMAIPINYDFSNAMFSGWLDFTLGYELYMIIGWLLSAVRYLLAAAYVLALFAVLKNHPMRLKFMLLTGAGLVMLGLLMLLGMTQLGWYFARWMLPFASAMTTSGLLVIVLAFAFRIFRHQAQESGGREGEPPCSE